MQVCQSVSGFMNYDMVMRGSAQFLEQECERACEACYVPNALLDTFIATVTRTSQCRCYFSFPCAAGCMVMASNESASANTSLAAVSVSSATGALLLAEAARGASVSAWAPSCAPLCRKRSHLRKKLRDVCILRVCD